MFIPLTKWPVVSRNAADILKLFSTIGLGLDLEWDKSGKPSVIGVSDDKSPVSVSYAEGKPYFLELLRRNPKVSLIGHNVARADLFVLADEGITIPLEQVEDTIIWHWLVNMHLCKTTNKTEEDGDEKRGRGFMNLGSMASVYTNLSYWKECRGKVCEGPCPEHDVWGYNGTDAIAPVLALPQLKKTAMLRGVSHLYPLHRKLAYILEDMSRHGVTVDVPYVANLRAEFDRDKEAARERLEALGMNPASQKQVLAYFKARGIHLADNTEPTIREAAEENESSEELGLLLAFKELGNGPDRWFAPQYNDKHGYIKGFLAPDGKIHANINFYTSSARMMMSSPNLQNVAKRRVDRHNCTCGHGVEFHFDHPLTAEKPCSVCLPDKCKTFTGINIGKKIRRAIIAPEGYYLLKGDYSNAENRNFLHLAGYTIPRGTDLHAWVVELAGITPEMEFAISLGGPREAAKSVQHAGNYLEGLQLKTPSELRKPKVIAEIQAGARVVYPKWTFKGKVVTFTGINLAKRAFGDASYENRRKALEIAEKYFNAFPKVRELQMKITKQIEEQKAVRPPHGYVTLSYGRDEDRMKTAAAIWGSQPVAHLTKLALIDIWEKFRAGRAMYGVLQVHDEIVTEVPLNIDPKDAANWLRSSMEVETPEIPGMVLPIDPSFGAIVDGVPSNWRDQTKIK